MNEKFLEQYNEIRQSIFNTNNVYSLIEIYKKKDLKCRDIYGRTFLHMAVEHGHIDVVKFLFSCSFNPNACEGCGFTPLGLAVIKGNEEIVKLLLDNYADIRYSSPDAFTLAEELGENCILKIFNETLKADLDEETMLFAKCSVSNDITNHQKAADHTFVESEDVPYERTSANVLMFGDNGCEKLVRSVKLKSDLYNNFLECPGDMHASGYAVECMSKVFGETGMFNCLQDTLKRKNNAETFGSKKFQDGNLQSNEEAAMDIAIGYGLAVFNLFKQSEYFPTDDVIVLDPSLVVKRFKLFITSMKSSTRCSYFLQMIELFGPWIKMYFYAIRNGDGLLREVVWLLGILIYGPMQKKNYYATSFVHCVNLLYHWPKLFRDVVSKHFCVSVKHRAGKNIPNDEYVETYCVKPLKMYCSGHTSVKLLQMLSGSCQLVKQVREAYAQAFKFNKSKPHKSPHSLVDQMKVSKFCLEQKFFDESVSTVTLFGTNKKVQATYIDVVSCGRKMLGGKFPNKMYTYYKECRKSLVASKNLQPPS